VFYNELIFTVILVFQIILEALLIIYFF